ncbi:MAG: bifunctional DNA-formamidopyrimidine glycosylase/DNA-(apurinic or apyrimidinic site) lyase [Oceanococcus sp.]
MPELPEVETTCRGIWPALKGRRFLGADIRQARLRWPIPEDLSHCIEGQNIVSVQRRAKYVLIELPNGHIIIHLGMSGRLRVVAASTPVLKHDHIDLLIDSGDVLRLNDPRRFGSVLWQDGPWQAHRLLSQLGPEPLADDFNGEHLYPRAQGLRSPVKAFIMDQKTVVGVGNIYASESLFRAGIHPRRAAGRISLARYKSLAEHIKNVLDDALAAGGTTLRDYTSPDGSPGYFVQSLDVYDRAGQACNHCEQPIQRLVIGQRASYFCPSCQR